MPRPLLTDKVATSLEALLESFTPVDYLGTDKELGIKYLTALVQTHRSPEDKARRQKNVNLVMRNRKAKS